MNGWIKIHKKLLKWEWYTDTNTKVLFVHLLLCANWEDERYKGMLLKEGTLLTGRDLLANQTGLSVQQVRTSLKKLVSTNEITIKSNAQGTEIHIVKYADHQINNQQSNQRATNEQPTSNQRATTLKSIKKDKNIKKNKEVIILPFESDNFKKVWNGWKEYKKEQFEFYYKTQSEKAALTKLFNMAKVDLTAILIIQQSIENGWKGFFELKKSNNFDKSNEKIISVDSPKTGGSYR